MADSTDALSAPTATATKGKRRHLLFSFQVSKSIYQIFLQVQNVKLN